MKDAKKIIENGPELVKLKVFASNPNPNPNPNPVLDGRSGRTDGLGVRTVWGRENGRF